MLVGLKVSGKNSASKHEKQRESDNRTTDFSERWLTQNCSEGWCRLIARLASIISAEPRSR
jgi:hypothetical protein